MKQDKSSNILSYFKIAVLFVALLIMLWVGYSHFKDGTFSVELVVEKWVQAPERYEHSQIINENKGVAFINYNCITKSACRGQYIIFIDKINGNWVVNESSKKVLW